MILQAFLCGRRGSVDGLQDLRLSASVCLEVMGRGTHVRLAIKCSHSDVDTISVLGAAAQSWRG